MSETCIQYFQRRLTEGWKCVSLEGYNAVLLSPEGIRRELDLRNDVETLRPNSDVQHPNWSQYPAEGSHYDKVDDVTPDESATYVYYGTLLSCDDTHFLIKENGVLTLEGSGAPWWHEWHTVSRTWTTRPSDGQPFTVADIDALQVGVGAHKGTYCITSNMLFGLPASGIIGTINSVKLYYRERQDAGDPEAKNSVTQVYVEVDYTPGVEPEVRTGIVPITIKPAGLYCEAEIYLGPDPLTKVATSGRFSFISTGEVQEIRLPITMPLEAGTYHIYLDVLIDLLTTTIPAGDGGPAMPA